MAAGPDKSLRADIDRPEALQEIFRFRPRWWWDPVPPWVLQGLDRSIVAQLGVISLQTERAMLDVQAKALDQTIEVLQKQQR